MPTSVNESASTSLTPYSDTVEHSGPAPLQSQSTTRNTSGLLQGLRARVATIARPGPSISVRLRASNKPMTGMEQWTKDDLDHWRATTSQWTIRDFEQRDTAIKQQLNDLEKQPGTYTTKRGREHLGRLLDEANEVTVALNRYILRAQSLFNRSTTQAEGRPWRDVLEVTPGPIAPAALRAAYRKSALKHHPDKHPEDPAGANSRFNEVTCAYEQACRELGIPTMGV